MSLDQLPINLFDALLIVVLVAGIIRGRKHGMSEELMSLLTWLAVLFGCAVVYQPGGELIGQFTNVFSRLSCYLMAYVAGALLVFLLFAGIKRGLGGKLLGSDIFGRSEYYLGMGSGLVRFSCMLLAALALLNARYFSPTEVRAMERFRHDVYGSDFFPTPALNAGHGFREIAHRSMDQREPRLPADRADQAGEQGSPSKGIRFSLRVDRKTGARAGAPLTSLTRAAVADELSCRCLLTSFATGGKL